MSLLETPEIEWGAPCPEFALPDPEGRIWSRDDLVEAKGLVIAVICNHCPYVIRMIDALAADLRALQAEGFGACAIMPNDWTTYPADGPDRMPAFAKAHGLTVPYLVDETQTTARALGAVCTPDLFGFDATLALRYRGRQQELTTKMRAMAEGQDISDQTPSMGCSIKWR